MPLELSQGRPVILLRQSSYERSGILRHALDERFNLTADEFAVEGGLIRIGPLPSDDLLSELIAALEDNGLVYFDDFFDLSGNWPEWLTLFARNNESREA
jgi:hypothetical protein